MRVCLPAFFMILLAIPGLQAGDPPLSRLINHSNRRVMLQCGANAAGPVRLVLLKQPPVGEVEETEWDLAAPARPTLSLASCWTLGIRPRDWDGQALRVPIEYQVEDEIGTLTYVLEPADPGRPREEPGVRIEGPPTEWGTAAGRDFTFHWPGAGGPGPGRLFAEPVARLVDTCVIL